MDYLSTRLKLTLECHVDADFARGWTPETSASPEAVLSRTGFVNSYAGCQKQVTN